MSINRTENNAARSPDERLLLSVIVPVYNTAAYLGKCLDSILAAFDELGNPAEILVINDGSTDESAQIIARYAIDFPDRIQVFSKPNGGLSDVKNFGLARARGEFVTFVDSDDWVDPGIYRELLGLIASEQADVAICDIECIFQATNTARVSHCINPERPDALMQVLDTPLMTSSCNKVVRRMLYDGLSFPVGLNNEDVTVTPLVLARARRVCHTFSPAYKYVQRAGSIQNSGFDERRLVIFDAVQLALQRTAALPAEDAAKIAGVLYNHQILAILFYPIREQPFGRRVALTRRYIALCNSKVPGLFSNQLVAEFIRGGSRFDRFYRQAVLNMLRYRWASGIALTFSLATRFDRLQKKIRQRR